MMENKVGQIIAGLKMYTIDEDFLPAVHSSDLGTNSKVKRSPSTSNRASISLNADDYRNSYTYALLSHNELFRLDAQSGVLRSTSPVDYERVREVSLLIAIVDVDGATYQSPLVVEVTDSNDNPPTDAGRTVTLTTAQRVTGRVSLGAVSPRDPDTVGRYGCAQTSAASSYEVDSDCEMFTVGDRPAAATEAVTVRLAGNDGGPRSVAYEVTVTARVYDVRDLSTAAVTCLVTGVRFSALHRFYAGFVGVVQTSLDVEVGMLSVSSGGAYVRLVFTARDNEPDSRLLLSSERLRRELESIRDEIEAEIAARVEIVSATDCSGCSEGGGCSVVYDRDPNLPLEVAYVTRYDALVSYPIVGSVWCDTPPSGGCRRCVNGVCCRRDDDSWVCRCNRGWAGPNCTADVDECSTKNACDNGGTCTNNDGSFVCNCKTGWTRLLYISVLNYFPIYIYI